MRLQPSKLQRRWGIFHIHVPGMRKQSSLSHQNEVFSISACLKAACGWMLPLTEDLKPRCVLEGIASFFQGFFYDHVRGSV